MAFFKQLYAMVRERGGVISSARSLLRKLRSRGLAETVLHMGQLLRWGHAGSYAHSYERWYSRQDLDKPARATTLFEKPLVLVIGPMDLPQCRKYRIVQKLEVFQRLNIAAEMSHYQDSPRVFDKMQLATHILFYRVPMDRVAEAYLQEARRLGLFVGYDIDDPIFDRQVYARNPNLATLSQAERVKLIESSDSYLQAMQQVDFISVSTPGMADLASKRTTAPVHIWPNLLDGETLSIADAIPRSPGEAPEHCVISYMSGSRAHDRDFEVVAGVLAEVLDAHEHTRLLLGGYFRLPEALDRFRERITELPFSGYAGYLNHLQKADINIVPLVIDEFNECKSAIRYLEAAALGIPTIAAKTGDFKHCVQHGMTGLLAETASDWREFLEQLVSRPDMRREMGAAASDHARHHHSVLETPAAIRRSLAGLGLAETAP
jgi:glycosyltransferase involved in cell wall biosynthesis